MINSNFLCAWVHHPNLLHPLVPRAATSKGLPFRTILRKFCYLPPRQVHFLHLSLLSSSDYSRSFLSSSYLYGVPLYRSKWWALVMLHLVLCFQFSIYYCLDLLGYYILKYVRFFILYMLVGINIMMLDCLRN